MVLELHRVLTETNTSTYCLLLLQSCVPAMMPTVTYCPTELFQCSSVYTDALDRGPKERRKKKEKKNTTAYSSSLSLTALSVEGCDPSLSGFWCCWCCCCPALPPLFPLSKRFNLPTPLTPELFSPSLVTLIELVRRAEGIMGGTKASPRSWRDQLCSGTMPR